VERSLSCCQCKETHHRREAKIAPASSKKLAHTEFHFLLDTGARGHKYDRAVILFGETDHQVEMVKEEEGVFSAVVEMAVACSYNYTYHVWEGDESFKEAAPREVIPSKRREVILDKFNEFCK